jgi:hypothetical protein
LGDFDVVISSSDRFEESPNPIFASNSTTSTDAATRRSAFCKPIDCAIDPINGGPEKDPNTQPMRPTQLPGPNHIHSCAPRLQLL